MATWLDPSTSDVLGVELVRLSHANADSQVTREEHWETQFSAVTVADPRCRAAMPRTQAAG